jgi:serine/threonine protein kinase
MDRHTLLTNWYAWFACRFSELQSGEFFAVKVMKRPIKKDKQALLQDELDIIRRFVVGTCQALCFGFGLVVLFCWPTDKSSLSDQSIKHENVTQLHEVQETANVVFIVLQLASGGELFDRVIQKGSYSEHDASSLVRQLLTGVAYLHSQGIVHRDLKPENLLFADSRDEAPLLITDFGLATRASGATLSYTCGTPGYVAPEMALNQLCVAFASSLLVGVGVN